EEISDALAQGNISVAERLAHTLKGVAGNIGAKSVQAPAGALEKMIRARASAPELEPAKRSLGEALDPILGQIRSLLIVTPPETDQDPVHANANPVQSREAAAQLTRLLTESDPAAADFIAANRATLRPLFASETWPQFEKLVQD